MIDASDYPGVSADSRAIRPGWLFVALPGAKTDGRLHIAHAVARGAAAVLAEPGVAWPEGVPARPMITHPEPRQALSKLAAAGQAQPEVIAAVTGTNGKTSVVEFLRQIWRHAGLSAASLGTLGVRASGQSSDGGLTTPDPVTLAATLAQLAHAGVSHAAIEASSHGLAQFRLDGLRLAAGAFTNLTRDHLDYHGDMDAYRRAKLRLFRDLLPPGAPVIVCASLDAATMDALRGIAASRDLDLRIVGEGGTDLRLRRVVSRPDGQMIELETGHGVRAIEIALPGRFQVDNVLVATGLAERLGVADALDRIGALHGVRGRLEQVAVLPNGAAAYVDYAHTPDALARVLTSLRPHTAGKLHVVFGAGGDRDRGKRPLMGEAASRLANVVIVTDDNPRNENPESIRAAVIAGCHGAWNVAGRDKAIALAMNALAAGDVLVVAGKGHETGQTIGDVTIPFDDAAVIRALAGIAA